MAMKDGTDGSHNKMQEMRRPRHLYRNEIWAGSMLELCQIRGRPENEFQRRMNSAAFAQSTVNRLSQRLNRSDSMEGLLTLLRRFTVRWEQNVLLGDHRWQWENMKAMQRFAKGLSKELLKFDTKYSNLWNAEVRDQIRLLSTELGQFVTPDTRRLSVQDIEVMVAHGRMAYELTRGLTSYLEKETGKPSNEP
jgi:hypothetical protein